MKSRVLTLAVGLSIVFVATQARNEPARASAEAIGRFNAEAPRILNDLVCVKTYEGGKPTCASATLKPADQVGPRQNS